MALLRRFKNITTELSALHKSLSSVSYKIYCVHEWKCPYLTCRKSKNSLRTLPRMSFQDFHSTSQYFKRRKTDEEKKAVKVLEYPKVKGEIVGVWKDMTVGELAEVLKKDVGFVKDLFLNQVQSANSVISDMKALQLAIRRSGKRMTIVANPSKTSSANSIEKDVHPRPPAPKSALKPRPPVVTVMGHVDHGKTTLLDALRHSSVVDQEFGGITQHIGAFSVTLDTGAKITFLDTPGHAAFSAMRARGASATDIVVLVVAADDGVMEQTVESVRMAREAHVPIFVAINKIDAPKADVERTCQMLTQVGIQVEQMGGDIQAIPISALKKQNLTDLVEALVLQAELLEIRADPTGPVEGIVIESKMDPSRGKLCTIIVQRGTLRKSDVLVAGPTMGRVRVIRDSDGNVLQEVTPGNAVEIEGWKDLPSPGELVLQVESEQQARDVVKVRQSKLNIEKQKEDAVVIAEKVQQHQTVYKERLKLKRSLGRFRLRNEGPRKPEIQQDESTPVLNILVKSDVDGTLEAVLDVLDSYDSPECKMELVHYGVGPLTENELELAKAFNGIIYTFNTYCPVHLQNLAENWNITIKNHNVIYKLVEDVREEINTRLPKKEVEEIIGEATVLQQFEINVGRKKVPVAGCRCTKGALRKSGLYKIIRNEESLHLGQLAEMRHLKNEVDIIKTDLECGLQFIDKTVTFEPGDKLICFQKKLTPQTTTWDPGF